MPIPKEILQEWFDSHGNLVIYDFKIVKLIGFSEDRLDYYNVYCTIEGKIIHSSCVIGFTPIKGFVTDVEYNHIAAIWNFNTEDQKVKFSTIDL